MAFDLHTSSLDDLIQWLRDQRRQDPKSSLAQFLSRLHLDPQLSNDKRLLDLACVDLIERRRLGVPVRVEDYLREFPRLARKSHALDLIDADLCIHAELGQPVQAEQYIKRFPQLADEIRDLVALSSGRSMTFDLGNQGTESDEDAEPIDVPRQLGGYRILRLLGRGAMGTVFEAKQLSLDRTVALKTLRGRLVDNASSLARFTREAYAAAQLTHHNVVQIYDFGEDNGRHFFSMEWVRGGPLNQLVRERGKLQPRLAAGYTLQAARGLQFAHRHGMVHRDVKPANLLLSTDGVVKLADLGLVKVPDQVDIERESDQASVTSGMQSGTEVTMQGTAVGTPAFMAPEQGADASGVDHRADIYSLGCTLFYLLSGRPPFDASETSQLMEQHAKLDPPDIVQLNPEVPFSLAKIIARAMEKRPENRYQSAQEMVADLESFIGVGSEGAFTPNKAQANQWSEIAKRFDQASLLAKMLGPIVAAFGLFGLLMTVGLTWLNPRLLLCGPSLLVGAFLTATALSAGQRTNVIVQRIRHWIATFKWHDFLSIVVVAAVLIGMTMVTGMWLGALVGAILGIGVGFLFEFIGIAPMVEQQREPLEQAQRFIRDLRIDGADEAGIRRFTAEQGGESWQPLFEALFGYDALCEIRAELSSDSTFAGRTSRSLRDHICDRMDKRISARRRQRDHKQLANIEQRSLRSQGMTEAEARQRAWQMAAAVMEGARQAAPHATGKEAAELKRQRIKAMLADARSGKYKQARDPETPLKLALGGHVRLLAGCLLLAWFTITAQREGLLDLVSQFELQADRLNLVQYWDQLAPFGEQLNIGIAGLLLCMSAFVSGWRMSPFALVATLVILFGASLGIPAWTDRINASLIAVAIGLVIYIPGVLFGEQP